MNRGSYTHDETSFVHVSSDMFLAVVEGSSQTPKQQHFWECEISPCSQTTTDSNHTAFFSAPAQSLPFHHLDHYFPAPPLLPSNPYFAVPTILTDYHMGLLKSESVVDLSGGGTIALNLGRRTYFSSSTSSDQGFLPDSHFAGSSSSSSIRGLQFRHPMFGGGQPPARCQAEGCKSDLSRAKHYHRRHKVCEFHSKATLVVVGGLHQRFCQQCSRFHVLAEFDEAKRSCRKRLAEHNRRRRKLPPTTTTAYSSSKPKPPPNSTRQCTKDRTSMDGPAAAAVCVGGVEVDKVRAGGSAAAAMYVEQGRGEMAINHNTPLGEIKVAKQQKKNTDFSRSVVDNGNDCYFHRHNFFSHETGTGGDAGQSSAAAAAWPDFL